MTYRARCGLVALLSAVAFAPSGAQQGADCPRRVELMTHGRKDVGGTSYREMADDPSFTPQVFLKHFGRLFARPRLRLNVKDLPEYSLTATFIKKEARYRDSADYSILAIVFSFNGGDNCTEPKTKSSVPHFPDDYLTYYGASLIEWTSRAWGHDIAAHVPMIAQRMKETPDIEETMLTYEHLPEAAVFESHPGWCDWKSSEVLPLYMGHFKTPKKPQWTVGTGVAHSIRFVATTRKGSIENGDIVAGDPKARVFTIAPSHLWEARLELSYTPPKGSDKSDVVTVYRSCEICYEKNVPLSQTSRDRKLGEIVVDCRPWRWSGTISVQRLDRFECSYRARSGISYIKHEADEQFAEITVRNAILDLASGVIAMPDFSEGGSLSGTSRFTIDNRDESQSERTKTRNTSSGKAQIPLGADNTTLSITRDVEAMESQIEALGKKAGAGDMAALEAMNKLLSGELPSGSRVIVSVMLAVPGQPMPLRLLAHRETKMDDGSTYTDHSDTTLAWSPGGLQMEFPATYSRDAQGRQSITGETNKVVEEPHGGTGDCPPRKITQVGNIHLKLERKH